MKLFYLRDKNNHAVACVASELTKEGITFAVSTHNPIDPFSKAMAREVAMGRLVSGRYYSISAGNNVKARLLHQIVMNGHLPNRTRVAAQLWLDSKNKAVAA